MNIDLFLRSIRKKGEELKPYLETALRAAYRAGDYLLTVNSEQKQDFKIDTKAKNDYVTEVDRISEKIVIETIHDSYPEHSILAEESGKSQQDSDYRWIIDPLDGTTNFINGYPIWSVSIAMEHKGEVITGVVYAPIYSDFFYAVKGGGAYMNGEQIEISRNTDFSQALLLTGFPFKAQKYIDVYQIAFKELLSRCSGMRRAGSAAIDLSWLAAGRADGFWELSLSPWDVAAGALIIREAGGVVSDIFGDPDNFMRTGHIIAGNEQIHREILKTTKLILKDLK